MRTKLKFKVVAYVLAFFMMVGILPIFPKPLEAASYGTGSAGAWTISSAVNLSSKSNHNFTDITITNGGTLTVNMNSVIAVTGTLTIQAGGKIVSTNGANGTASNGYNNGTPGTAATPIVINAANVNIAGGTITGGTGGTGGNAYGNSSSGNFLAGAGGAAGHITINSNSFTMSSGTILGGTGGQGGAGWAYGYSGMWHGTPEGQSQPGGTVSIVTGTLTLSGGTIQGGVGGATPASNYLSYSSTSNSPAASGGPVTISGVNTATITGGTIKGGTGARGIDRPGQYYNNYTTGQAGNGGHGGNVSIAGASQASSSLTMSNALIQGGVPGDAGGIVYTDSDYVYGVTPGAAGNSGYITLNNFQTINLQANAQIIGSTGGLGNKGGKSRNSYGEHPLGSSTGGYGGTITIGATNLNMEATAKIIGGTGGQGGRSNTGYYSGSSTSQSENSRGKGGTGGHISLSVTNFNLASGARIIGGTGGLGGLTDNVQGWGGDGGTGGNITLYLPSNYTITKANKFEDNIQTGPGGNGNDAGIASYFFSGSSTYYTCFYAGAGGASGSATINFSGSSGAVDQTLVTIGSGGTGGNLEDYRNYAGDFRYYPATGGSTGNTTITGSDIHFNAANVVKYAQPGAGGTNTRMTSQLGANGTHGNISITASTKLNLAATNSIYLDNVNHSGRSGTLTNTITINSPLIVLGGSPSIRWAEVNGGTLNLTTNIRTFEYGHSNMNSKLKGTGSISAYVYNMTMSDLSNQLIDISGGGFQISTDISYALDPVYYSRWWYLFTQMKPYYSEDNGTNWVAIPVQPMQQNYKYSLPTSVKGNSSLRFGIIPQTPASGVTFTLNGVQITNAMYTPTQSNWPTFTSAKYAILESDNTGPVVHMVVNNGQTTTNSTTFPMFIRAFDNLTAEDKLTYLISIGDSKFKQITYSSSNVYNINLSDYATNPTSGIYNIFVKVLDESFNTGMATSTIYYMPAGSAPNAQTGGTGSIAGLTVKTGVGGSALSRITYNGADCWISKSNTVCLDFSGSAYPYYKIKAAENAESPAKPKATNYVLTLAPGEGIHVIRVWYANADMQFGNEGTFYVMVDNTSPTVAVAAANMATVSKTGSIILEVSAADTLTDTSQLTYSFSKTGTYSPLPADGRITKSGLANGINTLEVFVKDTAGNIGSGRINVWYIP